jgi:hypothetical protein
MKGLLFLALLMTAAPLDAQRRRLGGPDDPPLLAIGQRIRVWTSEPIPTGLLRPTSFGIPELRMRETQLIGTVVAYDPLDSLQLHRPAIQPVLIPGPGVTLRSSEVTLQWAEITQIDVPNGRDVLRGAVGGVGGAFILAGFWGLVERMFGCASPGDNTCGSMWKRGVRLLPMTVPLGTAMGFFSTRWKRVY